MPKTAIIDGTQLTRFWWSRGISTPVQLADKLQQRMEDLLALGAEHVRLVFDLQSFMPSVKRTEQIARRSGDIAVAVQASVHGAQMHADKQLDAKYVHEDVEVREHMFELVHSLLAARTLELPERSPCVTVLLEGAANSEKTSALRAFLTPVPEAGSIAWPPLHRFGEADLSVWHHALHAPTRNVIAFMTDTDAVLIALLALAAMADDVTGKLPDGTRWVIAWTPATSDPRLIHVSSLFELVLAMSPQHWQWRERLGSFAAAAIMAGNDYKESMGKGVVSVMEQYAANAARIGPLVTVEDRVIKPKRSAMLMMSWLVWTTWAPTSSLPAPDTWEEWHERLRKAHPDSMPSFAAARAAVDRAAKAFDYAATIHRADSKFDDVRWVEETDEWPTGFAHSPEGSGTGVVYVWDRGAGGQLLSPAAGGLPVFRPSAVKRGTGRLESSKYQIIRDFFAAHQGVPTPEEVKELATTLGTSIEKVMAYASRKKQSRKKSASDVS